ncbi:MAG TPA: hypothetical protein ENJ28_03965, partial [Gammaproteobacteria bacterium]|nr:hypothetical protein [Gammaproteobacteria bacterium]
MKKTILFLTLCILSLAHLYAQQPPPAFEWARQIGGSGSENIFDIATDSEGNVYVILHLSYSDTIDIDPGPNIYNIIIDSLATSATSCIKLNPEGELLWAKTFFSYPYHSHVLRNISLDSFGNIYITGGFWGDSLDFDPGPEEFYLSTIPPGDTIGHSCGFILKLNAEGSFIWAKTIGVGTYTGSNFGCRGEKIIINDNDFVYLTGRFSNTGDFDPGPDTFTLNPSGAMYDAAGDFTGYTPNIFIAKYTLDGDFIWAKKVKVGNEDNGNAHDTDNLAVDAAGNVYKTGRFWGESNFGQYTLTADDEDDEPTYGVYVFKLNSEGGFEWAFSYQEDEEGWIFTKDIAIDKEGDVIVAGGANNLVDLDLGTGEYYLSGERGAIIHKLSPEGEFISVTDFSCHDSLCDSGGYSIYNIEF